MTGKCLTAAAVAASLTVLTCSASAALKDGTYETQVIGHNAPFTVTVTVKNGKVTAIDTAKNLESNGVGRVALEKLTKKILDRQSIGVDVVTGATLTSFALLNGVEENLEKAGATEKDLAKWQKSTEKYATKPITLTSDVVVIGGGGSGMAAALSALEAGAHKVVILEKLGYLGGSTQVSGGAFNAVDDARQKPQGIVDSKPIFFEATMRGGHYVGNPELVHYLTYNATDAVAWLEKEGVQFRDKIGAATGSLGQRSHYGKKPAGWAYTSVFEKRLMEFGDRVEILTDTPAQHLIMKKGAVVGVKALRHGKQPITVNAASTVIATGGFGANIPMRQKENTGVWKEVSLDKRIGTTNSTGARHRDCPRSRCRHHRTFRYSAASERYPGHGTHAGHRYLRPQSPLHQHERRPIRERKCRSRYALQSHLRSARRHLFPPHEQTALSRRNETRPHGRHHAGYVEARTRQESGHLGRNGRTA